MINIVTYLISELFHNLFSDTGRQYLIEGLRETKRDSQIEAKASPGNVYSSSSFPTPTNFMESMAAFCAGLKSITLSFAVVSKLQGRRKIATWAWHELHFISLHFEYTFVKQNMLVCCVPSENPCHAMCLHNSWWMDVHYILGRLMVLIEDEYLYILFSIFIIEMEIKM